MAPSGQKVCCLLFDPNFVCIAYSYADNYGGNRSANGQPNKDVVTRNSAFRLDGHP